MLQLLLLWAMRTVPDFAPIEGAVNFTVMVQALPGTTVPQAVAVKEAAPIPGTVTPETTRSALPSFLTVMNCGGETIPTGSEPKSSDPRGDSSTATGAAPVPRQGNVGY